MTRIHGSDMTGKSPYTISPSDFAETLRDQHRDLIRQGTASASVYQFIRVDGILQRHTTMRMPLYDDGKKISNIVVVVDPNSTLVPA